MADLLDLLDRETLPSRVMLIGKESLITDSTIHQLAKDSDLVIGDLTQRVGTLTSSVLRVVRVPNWAALLTALKNTDDSFVVLVPEVPKDDEFKKVRAQFSKNKAVFILSSFTTEKARARALDFLTGRWRVNRKPLLDIMNTFKFDPVNIFLMDRVIQVYLSSVPSVAPFLGGIASMVKLNSGHSTMAEDLLSGIKIADDYSPEVNIACLNYLAWIVNSLDVLRYWKERDVPVSPKSLASASGLPMATVVTVLPLLSDYSDRIESCRELIAFGYKNSTREDLFKVIGAVW